MKPRRIFEHTKVREDENGQQMELEYHIVRTAPQDEFIQVFLNDLGGLYQIESAAEFKILLWIWKEVEMFREDKPMGNAIAMVRPIKERIAADTGLVLSTINNGISSLTKKGLLIKMDRALYCLNPKYFFKGYSADRLKAIKVVLEYRFIDGPDENTENIEQPPFMRKILKSGS